MTIPGALVLLSRFRWDRELLASDTFYRRDSKQKINYDSAGGRQSTGRTDKALHPTPAERQKPGVMSYGDATKLSSGLPLL
jgi:hypothetical protein